MGQIVFIVVAMIAGIIVVSVSPLARAICWDAFVHPRYRCLWEKQGKHVRELNACMDKLGEN